MSGDGGLCRGGVVVIFLQGVCFPRANFEKTGQKVQKFYPQTALKTAKRKVIHRSGSRLVQGRLSPGRVEEPTH